MNPDPHGLLLLRMATQDWPAPVGVSRVRSAGGVSAGAARPAGGIAPGLVRAAGGFLLLALLALLARAR